MAASRSPGRAGAAQPGPAPQRINGASRTRGRRSADRPSPTHHPGEQPTICLQPGRRAPGPARRQVTPSRADPPPGSGARSATGGSGAQQWTTVAHRDLGAAAHAAPSAATASPLRGAHPPHPLAVGSDPPATAQAATARRAAGPARPPAVAGQMSARCSATPSASDPRGRACAPWSGQPGRRDRLDLRRQRHRPAHLHLEGPGEAREALLEASRSSPRSARARRTSRPGAGRAASRATSHSSGRSTSRPAPRPGSSAPGAPVGQLRQVRQVRQLVRPPPGRRPAGRSPAVSRPRCGRPATGGAPTVTRRAQSATRSDAVRPSPSIVAEPRTRCRS